MLLNQFFAVFIIAAQCAYLFIRPWNKDVRKTVFPITIGLLLPVAIWLLPLHGWESLRNIYTLQSGEHQAIYSLSAKASPFNVFLGSLSCFSGALGQPANMLGSSSSVLVQFLLASPALLLIGLMISRRVVPRPDWIALCLTTLVIYLGVSIVHSFIIGHTLLFQGRYWVFAYVFSYLLIAWALMHGLRNAGAMKCLAVCALLITCTRAVYTSASTVTGLAMTGNKKLAPIYIQPNEDYEGVAGSLIKITRPGDTVSYKSWKLAQCTNWFLLMHPELTQRVDTMQSFPVMISNGPLRREVPFNRGRTTHARLLWIK